MRRHVVIIALALCAVTAAAACGKSGSGVGPGDASSGTVPAGAGCDWPMWGQNPSRTFSYPCATGVSPTTVKDLRQQWFFTTNDVVTATPAVVGSTTYFGDWSGKFYAVDTATGSARWTFQAKTWPKVYAGQIVSSAAVADVGGVATVFFGSARWLHALRAADGTELWSFEVGTGTDDDNTEIESSPVVVDGKVIFGTDVHNTEGQRAGVYALDAASGKQVWYYDPDEGQPASGCVDVWGSPAVDAGRRMVFFGTGSCDTTNVLWRPTSEAIIAIGLDDGARKWAYQPHEKSPADLDFAGAPNLFDIDGRALVGLGNKDGTYYTLDRATGELVWKTLVAKGGRTGGFIGPAAYARGIIAGGTAIGDAPFLHGLDAASGRILWQQTNGQAVYGAAAEANGVVFIGGNDFTLRALDLKTGDVLWSQSMPGVVAGGAAIVSDAVYSPVGIREPGLDKRSENSGVFKWGFGTPTGTTSSSTTSTTAQAATNITLTNPPADCIGSPCTMRFLKGVPAGITDPQATLQITTSPFSVTFTSKNLGDPSAWITPGTAAAAEGATQFALFASESDDNPVGGLLCVVGADGSCTATTLPRLATYNRITLLAVKSTDTFPTPADGLARLVTTESFEPPLTPAGVTATTVGGTQ